MTILNALQKLEKGNKHSAIKMTAANLIPCIRNGPFQNPVKFFTKSQNRRLTVRKPTGAGTKRIRNGFSNRF